MHAGMKLQDMLSEVVRHASTKRDFVADTKEHIRMVAMPEFDDGVALVLSKQDNALLERFQITENCHEQIATRLGIPRKYYDRLLKDHRDLVLQNVNTLFEREPELRMIRTLDGRARAFLSNSFRRVDNEQILEATLPVVKNEFPTEVLSTNVNEDKLRFKCLFTGPEHTVDVGTNGKPDLLRAGFEMGNSEVGKGSFYIRGFFYRGRCLNGCVYGGEDTVSFKQIHVGSRLGVTEDLVLSQATQRKEDDLIISAGRDVLTKLSSPEFTQQMGVKLRALRERKPVNDAHAAVEAVCKELRLSDNDSKGVLESFIRDQDYSQWGMVNAVTNQANSEGDYEKASRFEELGNTVINMQLKRWNQIASLERIAA